ncbi:MAG: hypothetical protein ACOZAL_00895 [Patescibacteria group bacterium]
MGIRIFLNVECDGCPEKLEWEEKKCHNSSASPEYYYYYVYFENPIKMMKIFYKKGWRIKNNKVFCPDCAKKMQEKYGNTR